MKAKTRVLVHLAILSALAVVLSLLEGLFAPLLPPGVKPGLSNIVTMLAAVWYGVPAALVVAAFKGVFALITRGAVACWMSTAGGLVSALATSLLLRFAGRRLGKIGISVIGAVLHNAAQLAVAVMLMGVGAFGYAPVLLLSGVAAGIVTGAILQATVHVIVARVPKQDPTSERRSS